MQLMSIADFEVLRCYFGNLEDVNLYGIQDLSLMRLDISQTATCYFLHFFSQYYNNMNEVKVGDSSLL